MLKLSALLLIIVSGVTALPAQAVAFHPASETALPQSLAQTAAARRCRPKVWSVLLRDGLAYTSKSTAVPVLLLLRPCSDSPSATPPSIAPQQEAKPSAPSNGLAELPAAETLRQARLLFIRARSSWFNREKLERELLKRREFGELGLEISRSINHTELILEITRKRFTTRFTCSIIEPTTQRVLAGTTISSLGGEVEPDLAEAIIKQFKAVHSKPATEEKKLE